MLLKIKFIFNSLVVFFLLQTFFLIKPFSTKANFLKYSSNPILQIGNLGSWDSLQLYGPAIIENNGLKMWFSGSDGAKRQIGQATFSTSTNWQKNNNNPIIDWGFVDSNDVGVEHPFLLYAPNLSAFKYKMWFNNVNQSFHFKLKYSTSENGLIWNTPEDLIFDTTSEWDSEERTAPTIFQDTLSKYHMWFTAKGQYNSKTTWRIGYATSGDGITWTKHPEPVLEPDQVWEGNGGIGNPSVLYEDGIYHMWYHGDRDIGHATSSGGIKWIKDPNNPVLQHSDNSNDFDYVRVMDPFVLNKDGVYYMYYSGENRDGRWQIGLATSSEIIAPTSTPTPTPTNTPTPTPTNTPIPTPTLTPTPTPTGALFSPIVIVPGLGASWNPKDIFSCSLTSSGSWKMTPFTSVYKRLINTLTKNAKLKLNSDAFVYNYDWRQPLDKQGEKLRNYIDKILSGKLPGTKVRLIGHSLGGLVIRSYLTNNPANHKAESILTLGTPHQGTVLAYPLWEKGEIWTEDKMMKWILTNLINHCKFVWIGASSQIRLPQIRNRSAREVLQLLVPSIKQLLPTFAYLRQNGDMIEEETMKNRNDWLISHLTTNLSNVSLHTLSGNDISTLRFLDVVDPSLKEKQIGDWLDGKPVSNEKINEGDGTILGFSSQIEGADNNVISGNHGDVVYSTVGIEVILRFLGFPDVKPAEEVPIPELTSKNILAISLDQPMDFKIVDPKGAFSQSEENLVVQLEPKVGAYRIKIPPSTVPQANLYIDLISIDKENSQSFVLNLKKGKPSEFVLTFTNFKTPTFKLFPL